MLLTFRAWAHLLRRISFGYLVLSKYEFINLISLFIFCQVDAKVTNNLLTITTANQYGQSINAGGIPCSGWANPGDMLTLGKSNNNNCYQVTSPSTSLPFVCYKP